MSVSPEDFKQALSRRATGVSIVTARVGENLHGMTVSAFTEVSLRPPLVLVCANRDSNTRPVIEAGGVFAINVLARDQQDLSNRFAAKRNEDQRFEGLELDIGRAGSPLLRGVAVNIDCRVIAFHGHGDHIIFVGEVQEVRCFDRDPLLYLRGSYGSFNAT
jgi:4-nitrophenol 2-monooxygenase / 4-nitrocatechol 4-monooxygenase, reductase component